MEVRGVLAFALWLALGGAFVALACGLLQKGNPEGAAIVAFFAGWTLKPNKGDGA